MLTFAEFVAWYDTGQQHEEEMKVSHEKLQLLLPSNSDRAHLIMDFTRRQLPSQRKVWLSLKNNHTPTCTRKKQPPDKHRSRRKFVIKDRVFLYIHPYQQKFMKTRASQKLSPSFFKPYKIGDHIRAVNYGSDLRGNSKLQLILQGSHRKWKFREDNSTPIYQVNKEAQVQLMIAWDHRIVTHHRLVTTADAGHQEQDVPTIGPRGTLVRNCKSRPREMELNLENKADLKRAGLLVL
ncbi:hypothetical protein BHE74_00036739 [Ensete ventricosum]|nr:hypothetical protein BHE74_00036739 [Ensete ventricosum]